MLFWLISLSVTASAAVIKNIPQVGPHYRVLTLEKNENPQNLLAIYTKLNPDCTIATNTPKRYPVLDYYWLMDRQNYKRVHPMILMGIRNRVSLSEAKAPNSFSIAIKDLKELKTDITDDIRVTAYHGKNGCSVEAHLKLGPSDSHREIQLTNIHSESRKTFLPPFRKINSVTLEGVDLKDGHPVLRKYSAAN